MDKQVGRVVAVLMAAMVSTAAFAGRTLPLIEPGRVALHASAASAPVAARDVRRAVLTGGRLHDWQLKNEAPGVLTLEAGHGTHRVTVDVNYDATGYEIKYRDSVEMNYDVEDGKPVIHPKYNKWVMDLDSAIRSEARAFGFR